MVNNCFPPKRLNEERIGGLQQQIEDLQKTLQEQGSKTEGVSETFCQFCLKSSSVASSPLFRRAPSFSVYLRNTSISTAVQLKSSCFM